MPEAYLNVTETATDNSSDAPRKVKEVALSMPLAASKVHFTRDGEAWTAWERYAKATSFDILQGNAVANDFKASPAWVTRRDLLRALKVKWSEVEHPLADLLAGGEIEQQELKNARGPATWQYRLATEGHQ